jgi:hypothetical protein
MKNTQIKYFTLMNIFKITSKHAFVLCESYPIIKENYSESVQGMIMQKKATELIFTLLESRLFP